MNLGALTQIHPLGKGKRKQWGQGFLVRNGFIKTHQTFRHFAERKTKLRNDQDQWAGYSATNVRQSAAFSAGFWKSRRNTAQNTRLHFLLICSIFGSRSAKGLNLFVLLQTGPRGSSCHLSHSQKQDTEEEKGNLAELRGCEGDFFIEFLVLIEIWDKIRWKGRRGVLGNVIFLCSYAHRSLKAYIEFSI